MPGCFFFININEKTFAFNANILYHCQNKHTTAMENNFLVGKTNYGNIKLVQCDDDAGMQIIELSHADAKKLIDVLRAALGIDRVGVQRRESIFFDVKQS